MAAIKTVSETARRAIAGQVAGRTNRAFYVAVISVSIVGTGIAAQGWLKWWAPFAFGAVAVVELGGVALSIFADTRRQLGERATAARLLSAGVAAGAVSIQFFGHAARGPALFFAGMSLLGYLLYLLDSAARRRDALRDQGKLADTPPAYGPAQWLRHPWFTRRARVLFLTNAEARLIDPTVPLLTRSASLAGAVDQVRTERRLKAIADALRTRIKAHVGPGMADLAVNTYDLPRIATGLARSADYVGLTSLLARDLAPSRLHKTETEEKTETAPTARPVSKTETARPRPVAPAQPSSPGTGRTPNPGTETGAQTPAKTAETATPAAATETEPAETDQTQPGHETDDIRVAAKLRPHLAAVMARHADWDVTVKMPPRHPEALSCSKIMAASGIGGKPLALQVKEALVKLSEAPRAAESAFSIER